MSPEALIPPVFSADNWVLLLTATIDPGGTPMVARCDPAERARDYEEALQVWLRSGVHSIVFVENSASDLSSLRALAEKYPGVGVEFISLDLNRSAATRGKGHGELLMIEAAFAQSARLRDAVFVAKCTGRLTVLNIKSLLASLNGAGTDVYCTLKKNLSFADSRFFVARPRFYLDCLFQFRKILDDAQGVFFEHGLARAALSAVSQGMSWNHFPVFPYVAGVSGTYGTVMTDRLHVRLAKVLYHRLRRLAYEY